MNSTIDDRTVSIDLAMASGRMAYPLVVGKRYYITTPRYDCRGTVVDYGPLGFILDPAERVFISGPLKKFFTGEAEEAEDFPGRHYISWMACAEASECPE